MEDFAYSFIKLTPEGVKDIIRGQVSYFMEHEKKAPNCCMLGMTIVNIINGDNDFKTTENGGVYFEGMKIFLDGDNLSCINVAYSPFLVSRPKIVL